MPVIDIDIESEVETSAGSYLIKLTGQKINSISIIDYTIKKVGGGIYERHASLLETTTPQEVLDDIEETLKSNPAVFFPDYGN